MPPNSIRLPRILATQLAAPLILRRGSAMVSAAVTGTKLDDTTFWDDAYSNGAYIKGGDAFPAKWAKEADAFRQRLGAEGRAQLDQSYGPTARERFDLFLPKRNPRGAFVFVHGGYWLAFDKSSWSHLATGALDHGWAVALPSYALCPSVRIADITTQVARAITSVAARVPGDIRLAGHSAGGHLVSRMNCLESPLPEAIRPRLKHTVSISGLHDLRPLLKTSMNATLRLDAEEAARESAALLIPLPGAAITCWVGSQERPEFRRQNALLANIWTGLGARTIAREAEGRHHFNVIEDLADANSALTKALLG